MGKYSIEELLSLFKSIHGDKYIYKIDYYLNNKQRINVECDKGHLFEIEVSYHLKGNGCPYCNGNKIEKDDILNELKETHNNKYEYPDFKYNKLDDEINILCKEHGLFTQSLKLHRMGSGCKKCVGVYSPTTEEFIEKCKSIDDSLDYSKVNYVNKNVKVDIICPKHGLISRTPSSISNSVCPNCYSHQKRFDNFLKRAIIKYGNYFKYYDFIDMKSKLKIENTETGEIYYQTPENHLNRDYFYNKRDINDFIKKSKSIHGDKYDYTKSVYISNKSKITITCKEHGDFTQVVNNHLRGAGCPKCNRFDIKENNLLDFIKENTEFDIITSDRTLLCGKELDIYIPELKLAFEFNGLYWHSELYKDRNYHLNKTKKCEESRIQLIHIWEDDWEFKGEIIRSIILNKIGKSKKIYARKCEIKEITDNKLVRDFLIKNHIQGFVGSTIKLGLFLNNELVSLMTFGNLRKSLGQKSIDGSYELLRFCNKLNTSVVGGASKLFKYFINNYPVKQVVSYSDNSRGVGNLYKNLGFNLNKETDPNYFYVIGNIRKHRFNFRKDKLIKEGYDPNKTEVEIMHDRNYFRIFDCGSKKWIFKN